MKNRSLANYAAVRDRLGPMPPVDPEQAYANGFIGAYFDPEELERLEDSVHADGHSFSMAEIATARGFAGQGKNGIFLLWKEIEALGLPRDRIAFVPQPVGNCVARATACAMYHTLAAAVRHGEGSIPEGFHDIAKTICPISSEVVYWWRSNAPNGDGWYAAASLRAAKEKAGLFIRRDLTDLGGVDLRNETRATAHAYSERTIPDEVRALIHRNPILSVAECGSFEEIVDAISAGAAVQTDGGEGWSNDCDEFGVARRKGSWAHSMTVTGCVNTEEFRRKYNTAGGLVFQNSWGAYNRTSHARIMGTNIGIPAGSFIALWEDCKRRDFYAVTAVRGFPNLRLPNWNLGELI